MTPEETARYERALHQIQTAVAFFEGRVEAGLDARYPATESKHLRVGITSTQITEHAVARLLIDKGVFTAEEYDAALVVSAELEAEQWRDRVRAVVPNAELG